MKGISTILAMILIVIIVVALIGLTYTFAVGLFSTTTTAASSQVSATTERLQKTVSISSAMCKNTTPTNFIVNFTIRHIGAEPIKASELAAILDGSLISSNVYDASSGSGITINNVGLNTGETKAFNYLGTRASTAVRTLVVSSPAGDITHVLTNCPTP